MKSAYKTIPSAVVLSALLLGFGGHRDEYPQDFFRSPLDIPLVMAGNFAEMRANHFHSGLDLKTQNREGLPVYAVADGWVSRVKVSPYGYGNVLYIAHPNGYTTVYAHLQSFSAPVAEYVKGRQYASNKFPVDKYLPDNKFAVKKGDVIGLSGNSGSSAGPHLHFEIRNSKRQMPLNPLLFGLEVTDTVPPKIFRIKVYPRSRGSYAEVYRTGDKSPVIATEDMPIVLDAVSVDPAGQKYELVDVDRVVAFGRIGFGIQVHDYHDGSRNRLGAYTIKLNSDDQLLFESELARFTFGQTRYINAHVDYAEFKENRRWIQRSHKLPGNALNIYDGIDDGYLKSVPGRSHQMKYEISDAAGNIAQLEFEIAGSSSPIVSQQKLGDASYRVVRSEAKTIAGDGMRVHFPANTFYDDLDFTYEVGDRLPGTYSSTYSIHSPAVPLHRSMTLSIRGDEVPSSLRHKALLALVNEDGRFSSAGGSYRDGFVVSKRRSFGNYSIVVDTTAPTIEPYRFPKDGRFRPGDKVRFKIKDDFSGVRSYAGFIDSEWVLFEYDAKKSLISYTVEGELPKGLRKLLVRTEDGKGNVQSVARSINLVQ